MNAYDFYEVNATDYFNSTFRIDPSSFLLPLAKNLKPGATILDIGCGSGRDLRWLKDHGFNPTGFERSQTLAELAEKHSGCPVIKADFTKYDFSTLNFDAILMVGALVHIEQPQLPDLLNNICKALVDEGLVYITLKEGHGQRVASDGRIFFLWKKEELDKIFKKLGFKIIDFSRQTSKLRPTDVWLGYLLIMCQDNASS